MTISLVGSTAGNSATGAVSSFTSNVPSGVLTDDLLIWTWVGANGTLPATPSGWLTWQSNVSTGLVCAMFYRWANAEPASYASGAITNGRWAYAMHAYRGVDTANPADVATQTTVGNTTTYVFPQVTTRSRDAWVLGTLGVTVAAGVTTSVVTSSNMTLDASQTTANAGATNAVEGIGHLLVPTPAAARPVYTVSQTTVRTICITSALRPAVPFAGWGFAA